MFDFCLKQSIDSGPKAQLVDGGSAKFPNPP